MSRVAIVTDSAANLAARVVEDLDITVVPLQVIIAGQSFADGVDEGGSSAAIAEAMREFRPVSTSRPSTQTFRDTYAGLAAQGVSGIVSVHLSGAVSATLESAQLSAREAEIEVLVVDSQQIGAGIGYAVEAAAAALAAGGDARDAAQAARAMGEQVKAFFYVDTLEYLRRSGRVGALGAMLGSALAVKPILTLDEGRITGLEKVRTSVRALSRLEMLSAEATDGPVRVTVSHLANPGVAEDLARRLVERLGERLVPDAGDHGDAPVRLSEVPAVIGAHVGPGLVGVIVAPASFSG